MMFEAIRAVFLIMSGKNLCNTVGGKSMKLEKVQTRTLMNISTTMRYSRNDNVHVNII